MAEGSVARPAAQGCRCAAIGGAETLLMCGGEVSGCQGDCPPCSCEDSEMRRPMRICALPVTVLLIKRTEAHKIFLARSDATEARASYHR